MKGKQLFNKVIKKVLKSEGGYTNDPVDNGNWTGGKQGKGRLIGTNYGISAPILEKWKGSDATVSDMKGLDIEVAKNIYWNYFWKKCHADKLPLEVQFIHYDASINHGLKGANKILQRVLGVGVDGIVGKITLGNAHKATLEDYSIQRMCEYGRIISARPANAKYAKGWTQRVKDVYFYTKNELI